MQNQKSNILKGDKPVMTYHLAYALASDLFFSSNFILENL